MVKLLSDQDVGWEKVNRAFRLIYRSTIMSSVPHLTCQLLIVIYSSFKAVLNNIHNLQIPEMF